MQKVLVWAARKGSLESRGPPCWANPGHGHRAEASISWKEWSLLSGDGWIAIRAVRRSSRPNRHYFLLPFGGYLCFLAYDALPLGVAF